MVKVEEGLLVFGVCIEDGDASILAWVLTDVSFAATHATDGDVGFSHKPHYCDFRHPPLPQDAYLAAGSFHHPRTVRTCIALIL